MATALGMNGAYNSSPDTPSPVYPDRLIRPLPKRTPRSRLSSDAVSSILYPLSPPVTQLFYGSPADNGDITDDARVYVQQDIDSEDSPERDHRHPYENGVDFESGDEDSPVIVRRSAGFRGSPLSPISQDSRPPKYTGNLNEPEVKPYVGPDGYDAFENTNNKKKRKIPTPASLSSHQSTLSQDFANMGLSGSGPALYETANDGSNTGTYYGTGNPASPVGSGISGSGRGRLSRSVARSSSGRGPLSVQNQNGWANSRTNRRDQQLSSPESTVGEYPNKSDQGIISTAIANAAVLPSPPRGSGNVSLLERQNTTPTKTQFTFTCESDSSKGMALQVQNSYALQQRQQQQYRSSVSPLPATTQSQRDFATQGTQTSPSMTTHAQTGSQQQAQNTETGSTGRKKKRSPGSIYALAARQRKIQQQYANLHHPPVAEDIWICEFCEYENIFGHPPEALIRQYEIKDRKERKRMAEKRRLLEKAKMKGRKGKKATKKAAAQHSGHDHHHHHHHHGCCDRAAMEASCYHHNNHRHHDDHDDDEDEDDYLENEYDEDPVPISAPNNGPSPASVKSSVPPGNNNNIPPPPKIATTTANRVNGIRDGETTTTTSRPS